MNSLFLSVDCNSNSDDKIKFESWNPKPNWKKKIHNRNLCVKAESWGALSLGESIGPAPLEFSQFKFN